MSRLSVFVSRNIPEVGLAVLKEHRIEVRVNRTDRPLSTRALLKHAAGKQGLICVLADRIDRPFLFGTCGLKVVSAFAAGYDNIDLAAATERGIMVTNTPGVLTEATADLTWALILSCARRVVEGDRLMRRQGFKGWSPLFHLGWDVYGKVIGIVGAGRIGQAVGQRARGFGMKIIYTSRTRRHDFEQATGARCVELETLLRQSDFVTLHCPLTPETRSMIGAAQLGMMRPESFLINVARGAVVDEAALVRALDAGRIAGAGLDVYEREPRVHAGLLRNKRVVLLPHIGSATVETRSRMARIAAENVVDALEGRTPRFLVNPRVQNR